MKRRLFVKSSLAASLMSFGSVFSAKGGNQRQNQKSDYYEWRTYRFSNASQKELTGNYLKNAFIPTLNRNGIKPVGVFEPMEGEENVLYVLITYPSMEEFSNLVEVLQKDKKYQTQAADYLNVPLKEPAYERIESSFMKAFSGIPRIEVPDSGSRIFELRIYESHSELAGNKKVKMFNEGELEIFRKTGLDPVFFGQSLVGDQLPNLTYLITFKDMEERKANWDKFREHPDWLSLKEEPEYKDTVSHIVNKFLQPLEYSQV